MTSILHTFKATIRKPYSDYGGYTIGLYLTGGERICPGCAREEWREIVGDTLNGYGSSQARAVGVRWEGPPEHCVQCNEPQSSEYGEVTA